MGTPRFCSVGQREEGTRTVHRQWDAGEERRQPRGRAQRHARQRAALHREPRAVLAPRREGEDGEHTLPYTSPSILGAGWGCSSD